MIGPRFKVGDTVEFNHRGEKRYGRVLEVLYAAGVNPETGVGRGYQDRLRIEYLRPGPFDHPDWTYTFYTKKVDDLTAAGL